MPDLLQWGQRPEEYFKLHCPLFLLAGTSSCVSLLYRKKKHWPTCFSYTYKHAHIQEHVPSPILLTHMPKVACSEALATN
jgi:hypothetical protein